MCRNSSNVTLSSSVMVCTPIVAFNFIFTIDTIASTSIHYVLVALYLNLFRLGPFENQFRRIWAAGVGTPLDLVDLFIKSMGFLETPHFLPARRLIFWTRPIHQLPESILVDTLVGSSNQEDEFLLRLHAIWTVEVVFMELF